jgi:hypothetical protein
VGDEDLTQLHLDVYDTKEGLWNHEHGELAMPEDWEFLPSGDAFVTRQVKTAGSYWLLWRPRGRNRPHRRLLGICAPRTAIERAQALAADTAGARDKRRVQGARQRDRQESVYREDLVAAVRAWLDFTEEFDELADEIARGAGERAAVVSSGRVGRTRKLPLEERAALAARAYIRHRFTNYEDELVELDPFETAIDEFEYRDVKRRAHDAVDEFLAAHRQP